MYLFRYLLNIKKIEFYYIRLDIPVRHEYDVAKSKLHPICCYIFVIGYEHIRREAGVSCVFVALGNVV